MAATNTAVSAKDGTGATLNLTFAAESVSTRSANKTYLGRATDEAIINPFPENGRTNPDVRATGQTINSATSNAAVTVALDNGQGVLGFNVAGLTASGATLAIEAANDGGTVWFAVNGVAPVMGTQFTTITTDQSFTVRGAGHTNVRLRVSATGAGTVTVAYSASSVSSFVSLSSQLPAGINLIGSATAVSSGAITNPASGVMTRPANTTAYAANQLVASSTTAGSIVASSFSIANSGGGALISRLRLLTNVTTGWNNVNISINLWSIAPTYTNGDGGAYAVATGASKFLGNFSVSLIQFGDGAAGVAAVTVGSQAAISLASGTAIFWDMQILGAATPISQQTFTLTAEVLN